ncbi:MAG: hypothetical protein H3C43_14110 [Leptonema sp. (in: Bacteria)]|nr:hypothetical protein [Leptonema sp. (in: bacteria)]
MYKTIGNVTYLWAEKNEDPNNKNDDQPSNNKKEPFQERLTDAEKTVIGRLIQSISNLSTPRKIRQKVERLDYDKDKTDQVIQLITSEVEYDPMYSAQEIIQRSLSRGFGIRKIEIDLKTELYEAETIKRSLSEITEEEWQSAFDIALDQRTIRIKSGLAKRDSLLRRGFLADQVDTYLNQDNKE